MRVFHRAKPKRQTIVFSTLITLILVLVSALIAQAETPLTTFTVSSGVYSGAPACTVWTNSTHYFAKNAYGYQIITPSTNATTVIQTALDEAPLGGKVYLKASSTTGATIYPVRTLNIPSFITLEGENRDYVQLKLDDGCTILVNGTDSPKRGVTLSNFAVVSDYDSIVYLSIYYAQWDCLFEKLYISVGTGTGILLYGGSYGCDFNDIILNGETSGGDNEYGISILPVSAADTCNYNKFTRIKISNLLYGVELQDGTGNTFDNCHFAWSTLGWGIRIYSSLQTLANGNNINECYFEGVKTGVYTLSSSYTKMVYGTQINGGWWTGGTRDIQLASNSSHTLIVGGNHVNAGIAAIQNDANATDTTIIGLGVYSGGAVVNSTNINQYP